MTNQRIKNSKNSDVSLIVDDLESIGAVAALSESAGGKVLIKGLIADILSDVETLVVRHKDLTMQEFVAISCGLKSKGELVKVLANANKNKKYLNDLLEEALSKEAE